MSKAFTEGRFTHDDIDILNQFKRMTHGKLIESTPNFVVVEYHSRDAEEYALTVAHLLDVEQLRM